MSLLSHPPHPKMPMLLRWLQKLEFPKKLGVCEKLFGKKLSKLGVTEILTGAGVVWKLDLANSTNRWIVYGLYDPDLILWARKFLSKDAIVVDSGANIGQTVMYLGQCVPQGRLLAFEPGGNQRLWLSDGLKQNKKTLASVEIYPYALGDKNEQLFLKDFWGGKQFHGGSSQISKEGGEPVQSICLDDFLKEKQIQKIDLWKLDVEGYELLALKGAENLLKQKKVAALYVELYRRVGASYKEHGIQIRKYLASFGYDCYVFNSWTHKPSLEKENSEAVNGLFLPRP